MNNLRKAMWDNASPILLVLIALAITIAGTAALYNTPGPFQWKGLFLMVFLAFILVYCIYACSVEVIHSLRDAKTSNRPKE